MGKRKKHSLKQTDFKQSKSSYYSVSFFLNIPDFLLNNNKLQSRITSRQTAMKISEHPAIYETRRSYRHPKELWAQRK